MEEESNIIFTNFPAEMNVFGILIYGKYCKSINSIYRIRLVED